MTRIRFAGMIALTAVIAACSRKPPPAPPVPAPPPARVPEPPPRVNQDSIDAANRARLASEAAARVRADSIAAANAAAAEAARVAALRAEARGRLDAAVFFDYDMDEIREDQRTTLDAKVPILNANPDVRIRIAGHTDDRGSDEYNLALGQRRAAAVRRYLVARGVAENRFDVESFGEQRPALQGDTEDTWTKNRRAEFELVAGGSPLRVP